VDRVRRLGFPLVLVAAVSGCGGGDKAGAPLPSAPSAITLTSPAFAPGATIPTRYTCSGAGESPPLRWRGVPKRARELTLVVEDPDAGRFVHWIVLGIPPSTTRFDAGRSGWTPPCPPKGDAPHHYVFALYAADAPLGLDKDASIDAVTKAVGAHAIARGELTGTFGRSG
jgi:phosphatidylethanolamine-binding protein (PEBP) family uncharacterized protein